MSIRYDGKSSGGVDSTTVIESLGRGKRSFGELVRVGPINYFSPFKIPLLLP